MAGYTLEQVAARRDPLTTEKWVVANGYQLPFGLPSIYVEGIDLPFLNYSVSQSILTGGINRHYAGLAEVSSFSMILYEDSSGTTVKWLDRWKSNIADPATQLHKVPREYKRDIPVELHAQDGSVALRRTLIGIWPVDTGSVSLGAVGERLIISQPFSIDNIR